LTSPQVAVAVVVAVVAVVAASPVTGGSARTDPGVAILIPWEQRLAAMMYGELQVSRDGMKPGTTGARGGAPASLQGAIVQRIAPFAVAGWVKAFAGCAMRTMEQCPLCLSGAHSAACSIAIVEFDLQTRVRSNRGYNPLLHILRDHRILLRRLFIAAGGGHNRWRWC